MSLRPLLSLKITISQDGNLSYFRIFATVLAMAVAVLLGIWLWLIGLDLVRSGTWASRVGAGWGGPGPAPHPGVGRVGLLGNEPDSGVVLSRAAQPPAQLLAGSPG